jgi:hypothetical protein
MTMQLPESVTKHTRRYLNVRGWLIGIYLAAIPQAIGKVIDFLGTNGIEKTGLGIAQGTGLSLKQLGITFVLSLGFNALIFLKDHPLPQVVDRPVTPPPFPANPNQQNEP